MLGALGGLLAVSFVIVRDATYTVIMSVAYLIISLAVNFGVPFL